MKSEPSPQDWLTSLYRSYQRQRAAKRLDRDVNARKNSFEIQDYAKRREAGKLGWQRRRGMA